MTKKISFSKKEIEKLVLDSLVKEGYAEGQLEVFTHTHGVNVFIKES